MSLNLVYMTSSRTNSNYYYTIILVPVIYVVGFPQTVVHRPFDLQLFRVFKPPFSTANKSINVSRAEVNSPSVASETRHLSGHRSTLLPPRLLKTGKCYVSSCGHKK